MPPEDEAVIRARCSKEFKKRVADFAGPLGLSESDIVRLAVADYLRRNANAVNEAASELLVLGVEKVKNQASSPRRAKSSPGGHGQKN